MKRVLLVAAAVIAFLFICYKIYCFHFSRMWDRFMEDLFRKALG